MDKPLRILAGEIKTPPLSTETRKALGYLLWQLQNDITPVMPHARPMSSVGKRCGELRVKDNKKNTIWRVIYRLDEDAVLILDVFKKKTQQTPKTVIDNCRRRLRDYDAIQ